MDILLVRPADIAMKEFKETGGHQHPINLLYLHGVLKDKGYRVGILDLEVEHHDDASLDRYLRERAPRVVGISVLTPFYGSSLRISRLARQAGSVVVWGGSHPSAVPEETLANPEVDVVVRGEGEWTLAELLDRLGTGSSLAGVEGVSYKEDGAAGAVHNPPRPLIEDLDSLPLPDRTALPLKLYRGAATPGIAKNATVMFTARGCPGLCTFCAANVVHGRRYRYRSVGNIMEEVDRIAALGFEHIVIDDDTFVVKKERILEFCRLMKRDHAGLTWDCDSRVNTMDRELLTAMKDAGCLKLNFGVESGSPRILKLVRKGITLDQVVAAFDMARQVGIERQATFMVGHPTETREDLKMTWKLVKRLEPDYLFASVCTPFPGTQYHEYLKERGFLHSGDWDQYRFFNKSVPWRNEHFSGPELARERDRLLRGFYLRPSYMLRKLARLRSWREVKYLAAAGLGFFRFALRRSD